MIGENIRHVLIELGTRSRLRMSLQCHLVRRVGKRDAVRTEPVRVGSVRLRVYGQHAVDHRCARGLIARVLVVEEITPEDVEPRLVDSICRWLGRAVLLNHRDIAEIAVIGDDLLAHRRELQRHACDCRRIRPVRTKTGRGSRIIDDFARILKIILDEVRACRDVADTIRRRYRRAPARDNVLVPLLHELFRIDVTRQRIEVVALAVTAVEGKHLVQEIGTVRVACIVKEGCLTIIERLGEATVTWYVLI